MKNKSRFTLMALALTLFLAAGAYAQRATQTVNAGTMIDVRVNDAIRTSYSDGQIYTATVANDVPATSGNIAIPRGAEVELIVREMPNGNLMLDLDSLTINGGRYAITPSNNGRAILGRGAVLGRVVESSRNNRGFGNNNRIWTSGDDINVPAGSVLTFRLTRPIETPVVDTGYMRDGRHYHQGYGNESAAYQAGWEEGRRDAQQNLRFDSATNQWTRRVDRQDYEAGYNQGYTSYQNNQTTRAKPSAGSVTVGRDNNVTWNAQGINGRVYVQVDQNARQLFAEGPSGTQPAPWIQTGHVYMFVLEDLNGNEIARERLDLRGRTRR